MNHTYPNPPSTPTRKRSISATQDEDDFARIHGSQKRLRIIEEALKEQKTPTASSQSTHSRQLNEVASPSTPSRPSVAAPQNGTTSYRARSVLPVTPKSSQESRGHNSSQVLQVLSPSVQADDLIGHSRDGAEVTPVRDTTRTPGRQQENNEHELTANSIGDMIHQLATQVPDYIRRLERKKVAAEKGRDARDTKISLLQAQIGDLKQEVERLKAREKELEDVIAAYEDLSSSI